MKSNLRYIWRNLREKFRLSVRNQHTDTEVWYMYLSPWHMVAGLIALILILFIIITTTVAYTPLLDYIPGHPGNRMRNMLIGNIMRIDSLEQEITHMQVYNENIALIMAGKNPVTRNDMRPTDSVSIGRNEVVPTIEEDSILRFQMESSDSPYNLFNTESARRGLRNNTELFAPVRGLVIERFDLQEDNNGVGIATTVNQQVLAVMDGTVISASWSPQGAYTVYIQHPDNMISVYKNLVTVLKKAGDRVRGGEVIGNTGTAEAEALGNRNIFEFELWHNGSPVDPQGYLIF